MPRAARNGAAKAASASRAARPAIRWAILLVAVNVVRNSIVNGDVIHLRVGQLNSVPGPSAIYRKTYAAIIRDGHAICIARIDPDVVIVAAGTGAKPATGANCFPAVQRGRKPAVRK